MIDTNKSGYVNFTSRNWSYAGDKSTYAKVETDKDGNQISLTVKRAQKGIVSSAYEAEMTDFCKGYKIDFPKISCGSSVKVEL